MFWFCINGRCTCSDTLPFGIHALRDLQNIIRDLFGINRGIMHHTIGTIANDARHIPAQ